MKWLVVTFCTIVILLVVVVFNIPASVVPPVLTEIERQGLLPPGSPRLILEDLHGTLWQGRANHAVVEIAGVPVDLGALDWTLSMKSLVHRNPQLTLASQSPQIKASAEVSLAADGEVTARHVEGRMPIAVLEPWFPMLVTGDIAFVIDHVVFNSQKLLALDGALNFEYVDWVGADHNMSLGSYMAQMRLLENNDLLVVINDLAAQLGMQGQFRVDPHGNYQFDALLQAREGLASEVAQSIGWLGRKDGNGNVVIKERGRL